MLKMSNSTIYSCAVQDLFALLALISGFQTAGDVLTLGSGASGGVFSPSMFLGAGFGGCFGGTAVHPPRSDDAPLIFAYAGMAGMIGGTTGAVVTAIIMMFEMTRDYTVILPVILTVALAWAMSRDNIHSQAATVRRNCSSRLACPHGRARAAT
jgi:chloride channel protein, CIC family